MVALDLARAAQMRVRLRPLARRDLVGEAIFARDATGAFAPQYGVSMPANGGTDQYGSQP